MKNLGVPPNTVREGRLSTWVQKDTDRETQKANYIGMNLCSSQGSINDVLPVLFLPVVLLVIDGVEALPVEDSDRLGCVECVCGRPVFGTRPLWWTRTRSSFCFLFIKPAPCPVLIPHHSGAIAEILLWHRLRFLTSSTFQINTFNVNSAGNQPTIAALGPTPTIFCMELGLGLVRTRVCLIVI